MMGVEQGWGKEQVLHSSVVELWHSLPWDRTVSRIKKRKEKKNLLKFINVLFSIRVWLPFSCTL